MKCQAEKFMGALPAFVAEANRAGQVSQLIAGFAALVQHNYGQSLADGCSIRLPKIQQAQSLIGELIQAGTAHNQGAAESAQQVQLLSLLVLQALCQLHGINAQDHPSN